MAEKSKRVLILYVDRDGDVSKITKVPTPIIGRDKNYEVALNFALNAPEDSDLNALFYAIKLYDEVKQKKLFNECEIATISGQSESGVESDIKIMEELNKVLSIYKADGIIFVSDGGRDELVIPIISSVTPIIAIKRVVVGQSESVEETFVILSRYFRKILEEPNLRRLFVGIPGALLIIYVLLAFLNLSHLFSLTFLLLIGFVAFIKGFKIDEILSEIWNVSRIQFISFIFSFVLIILAVYNGLNVAYQFSLIHPNATFLQLFGEFLMAPFAYYLNTVIVCSIALVIFIISRMLEHFMDYKSIKFDLINLFFIVSMTLVFLYIGNVLKNPSFDFVVLGVNALFLVLLLFFLNIIIAIITRIYE